MTRPHVLVVEDEPLLRERLIGLTVELGFVVSSAGDGQAALESARRQPPDLVVTDLQMPRMDGRTLIMRLREQPEMSEAPIMVVTANDARETKIALFQAGADDFITKPVDPDEYQARLRSLARKSAMAFQLGVAKRERDEALGHLEERNQELERLTLGLVAALEKANQLNDADTGNHIRRVSEYSALLGRERGCPPDEVDRLRRYAGLHDVGKVGIRDAILKKPGRLTDLEFEEMKTHTLIGAELLHSAGLPDVARNIALYHHEHWDGSGYPFGLSGESIPLEARIISVSDVFDALVSRRCYKQPYALVEARSTMEGLAGNHLDPGLVALFFDHFDEVCAIRDRYADESDEEGSWE